MFTLRKLEKEVKVKNKTMASNSILTDFNCPVFILYIQIINKPTKKKKKERRLEKNVENVNDRSYDFSTLRTGQLIYIAN